MRPRIGGRDDGRSCRCDWCSGSLTSDIQTTDGFRASARSVVVPTHHRPRSALDHGGGLAAGRALTQPLARASHIGASREWAQDSPLNGRRFRGDHFCRTEGTAVMLSRLRSKPMAGSVPALLQISGAALGLVAAAPAPLLVLDLHGEIVYRNRAADDLMKDVVAEIGEDGLAA